MKQTFVSPTTLTNPLAKLTGFNKIKNQRISHILITPTFGCAMACYAVFAIVLALFGFVCIVKAGENVDLRIRYDDKCKEDFGETCTFTFTPDITLVNPKLYY